MPYSEEIPQFIKKYIKKGKAWLDEGRVKDIIFSGVTYQILVDDTWTFLQFDEGNHLHDAFCACEIGEDLTDEHGPRGCPHLAAAWLYIFREGKIPLHQRFRQSLWHRICFLFADRLGTEPSLFKLQNSGEYVHASASGKMLFALKPKTHRAKTYLHTMLFERPQFTEETSIKFSNLTDEELGLWRSGQPSVELSYELSFWSDLAKWLFQLQESGEKYLLEFEPITPLPNKLHVDFEEINLSCYISQANLPIIIPALKTVDSPLKVIDDRENCISKIVYNQITQTLEVIANTKAKPNSMPKLPSSTYAIEGWRYVPGFGFVSSESQHLLGKPSFSASELNDILNSYAPLIKSQLEGCTLNEEKTHPSYKLAFDQLWNLHINAYLFEPGDLSEPGSKVFRDWVYLNDDGFYRIEPLRFIKANTVVPGDMIPDFIQKNRTWLNQHPGFQTHISSLDEQLSFKLDKENRLHFFSSQNVKELSGHKQHDFRNWFYVEGQGFFAKGKIGLGMSLRAGLAINQDQIPLFIRMNHTELQLIKGFFSKNNPIAKANLQLEVIKSGKNQAVTITPSYQLIPEYTQKDVRFFDDFVYVAEEGFHQIPYEVRLPENYSHSITLEETELEVFLNYELDKLSGLIEKSDVGLIKPNKLDLVPENLIEDPSNPGSFLMNLEFVSELGKVSAWKVWEALQSKKHYEFSSAGLLDLSDSRFHWLKSLRKQRFISPEQLSLTKLEVIRLNAFEEMVPEEKVSMKGPVALLKSLIDFKTTEPPSVKMLKSHLRPYQWMGVQWLWFLFHNNLSGLLCDDMGLGKTHQAMALVDAVVNSPNGGPVLIVCPTSVLYHWQEKLHTFLPGIHVSTFYGSGRSLSHFHHHNQILLTSYGIARNEQKLLEGITFTLAIFDEIQMAKNHHSRVHSALLAIQAKMRLGMTGTPLENHLRELKSLFDIVLPTYLPGETDFRDFFIKPIEKENDDNRRRLLTRLIKPFILRRKKEEVLNDLPEKIEEVAHCPLLNNQRNLYNELLNKTRPQVIGQLENGNTPIPYVHIFSVLSGLKQICNHPAAFLKEPQNYHKHPSGKWNLFIELLNEARQSSQKVVVFSHYLAMLDIMALYLKEQGVGFSELRGSTRDRADPVSRFQNDPDCIVFLGSLMAAGTGIDLTAASVVIHYDRWWNAAKEDQATDRVHRIGQQRGVQVFKLVTKDSFEERIDKLISSKGKLFEEVVTPDDHNVLKQFTRDELLDLLKNVDTGRGVATVVTDDEI